MNHLDDLQSDGKGFAFGHIESMIEEIVSVVCVAKDPLVALAKVQGTIAGRVREIHDCAIRELRKRNR